MAAFPNPFALGFGRSYLPAPSHGRPALANVGSRYLSGLQGVMDPFMMAWRPQLREPQQDTQEAWAMATAQTIEALHTSGWMAGGVQSARGQILFHDGLRPNLKPFGGTISSDPKVQAAWARDVEGRFTVAMNDARNIDWGERYTLAQLAGQAVGQYFATGEIVATMPYDERAGCTHGLKLNLMSSSRLTQANGPNPNTIQGVTLNPTTGAPIGYNFIETTAGTAITETRYVAARNEVGGANVIHILDNGPRAVRGITPFAPALRIVRQGDQLANSMHVMFMLQTIFAATVESQEPTEDMLRALQGLGEQSAEGDDSQMARYEGEGAPPGSFKDLMSIRTGWYENTNIDLGRFGKIAHLFPGEKLTFNRPNSPSGDYVNYQKYLLLEIARAMGITNFQLTGSFDGYTYTTAKMAIDEIWPNVLWRRALIARMYQAVFENWLEEDIMRGFTVLPGGLAQFYAQKNLICRVDWRGPPRPTADDLKTAKANQVLRAEGWASTESIASEYGNDWVEVADSQSATDRYREDVDLPPLPSLGGGGNGAGSAAVAGGDPERTGDAQQEREARLVGAMMRGDDAGVDAVLMENECDRRDFERFAVRTAQRLDYRTAA